jgi:hypothetical protein
VVEVVLVPSSTPQVNQYQHPQDYTPLQLELVDSVVNFHSLQIIQVELVVAVLSIFHQQ